MNPWYIFYPHWVKRLKQNQSESKSKSKSEQGVSTQKDETLQNTDTDNSNCFKSGLSGASACSILIIGIIICIIMKWYIMRK